MAEITKMIGARVGRNEGKLQDSRPRGVRLTFELTRDFPVEVVERVGEHVAVGRDGKTYIYFVDSVGLDGSDVARMELEKGRAIDRLVEGGGAAGAPPTNNKAAGSAVLDNALMDYPVAKRNTMLYILRHDIFGYGPFSILMEDRKNIEEIVVNAPRDSIGVYHSRYGYCRTNMRFRDESGFRYAINRLIDGADKELNSETPIIDAQLADGSRVHAQGAPYATRGAAASIRLSGSKFTDIRNMMKSGSATAAELAYLWIAIDTGCNIVVSGAPSSGKTTLLLALSCFVPRYQRVITIEEEVNELRYYSNFMNSVPLQGSAEGARVTVKDQIVNALHLRPDRLIVGEIRGSEASSVFSGANLGVPFMTTMHSMADGESLIGRLQTKPMSVEPHSISMLDIAVFTRLEGLKSRSLSGISEYRWLSRSEIGGDKGAEYSISELYKDGAANEKAIRDSKALAEYSKNERVGRRLALQELRRREEFLTKLSLEDSGTDIASLIASYGDIR